MDNQKASQKLKVLGLICIVSIFTLSLGYYLGDRGIRLIPTFIDLLLVCILVGLSSFLTASFLPGSLPQKTLRFRKRIIGICFAMIVIVILHLITSSLQKKTPLTALTPDQFQQVLSEKLELMETYDKEMDLLLQRMLERPALFSPETSGFSVSEETFIRECWQALYEYSFALDQLRSFYQDWYRFDLSRSTRKYHVQSYLFMYSADVTLYEKAMQIIALVKQNSNLVHFLNTPQPSSLGEDSFSRYQTELFGTDCNTRISAGRLYLRWLDSGLNTRCEEYSGTCLPLWEKIDTRLAALDTLDVFDHGKKVLDADMELLRHNVSRVWFPAQKSVAQWMGDTRLHRVGWYLINPELQTEANQMLEPADVLVSRKNWYMSNVGLPGFWPHAILYIGQPQKLTAYFDDPQVRHYLNTITNQDLSFEQYMTERFPQKWIRYKAGTGTSDYHVIEAIKYGVVLNPLEKACGDYLAAIRPNLDKVAKVQALIEAFTHLDKPYDFDFDFATDHALVCTELVWRSYRPDINKNGLNIEPIDLAGRKTLPANEIVSLYTREHLTPSPQFSFVFFIDASEKEEKAFFSDEAAFLKSVDRAKWSFTQE